MSATFDGEMMGVALRIARRGLGRVAPNPAVGAVVADEDSGEVIARGWTRPGGRPHAETEALARAGRRARGATMYVTLEPCSHHGKTPPCANAIVNAGLARVVVAIEDPDERVAGRGLKWLRDAGVAVEIGVRADEARWLTLGHILRVTEQRPFVQLKMALSANGEVPRGDGGRANWVTSAQARAHGGMLRAEADAILVGARTLVDDDPLLTCRLPGLAQRSPARVVLSSRLEVPLDAKVFATARETPTWVITTSGAAAGKAGALEEMGVKVVRADAGAAGGVDIIGALGVLADRGITRLLVEGGPRIWRAFSEAGVVDEAFVYQAHGGEGDARGGAASFISLNGLSSICEVKLAQDNVTVFRAKR